MPTYLYECLSCGHQEDQVRRIADRLDLTPCQCGGEMQFVISAPQIKVDTAQDIPWLREFAATRKEARFGKKPIETRTEYHKYLKDNNLRDPHKGEKGLTEF